MNKFMPYSLVFVFSVLVTIRIGYVAHEYYGDSFVAYAEEKKTTEDKLQKENKTQKEDSLETVNDKILKKDTKDEDKNNFASQVNTEAVIKNPKETCITGVMLKDVLKKLAYIDKREAEILEQQRLLETSDRRIREQVAKLKIIKNEIVESAKLADSTIAKESKRLISIYEKMKPKDAANIFNEMQPSVAAELLRTMKEDQSSQILSKMNPKNAYNVTLSLAGGIKETEKKYEDVRKE